MDNPVLRVSEVSKAYGSKKALENISLELPAGRIIGLLGPNGSGKTTLIKLIAGLLTLRKGQMLSGATLPGKICTTVLFLSLIVMVMIPTLTQESVTIIALVDAVFMLISFVGYARIYYTQSPMIQEINSEDKTQE